MRYPYARAWLAFSLPALFLVVGCDSRDPVAEERQRGEERQRVQERRQVEERQRAEERVTQAHQQVDRVQKQREQDRRVLETRTSEAESDTSAATLLWVSTAAALVVVILLLARERHLRRVLERLVERLLGVKERGP